jgi:hypothetical protein
VNEEKYTTASIEELLGISPDAFKKAFARERWAVNGYEMIQFLEWLMDGGIGFEVLGSSEKIGCYFKGNGLRLYVERRSAEALLRIGLIEARVTTSDADPSFRRKIYLATAKGQKFLSTVPSDYRGGEPDAPEPLEDDQFWTAILENAPNEPPAVYPYIGEKEPDGSGIISMYESVSAESCSVRVTGPHSLGLIPPSALAFDVYPILEGKVGPRIIRSWFDTVINPILADLKHKESLLVLRNWTLRVPPGHLESLRPVEESPWQVSVDNLEQFICFYPHVADLIERHDRERSELEEACRALHSALSMSKTLKDAYEKAKSDNSPTDQETPINAVLLGGTDEQHLEMLAQYIVNTAGELPGYYVHSPVWNKYSAEFLVALQDPAISPVRASAVENGERLLKTVKDLIALLKQTRARLSLWFDVPFVTAQPGLDE